MTPPVVWLADASGIAHATRPRILRTVCGRRPIAERLAWPRRSWCAACVAGLDERERPVAARKAAR